MAPYYDFGGRVALVTGGGSGIGRATCLLLAREGARVLVADINLEGARHTLSLMPGGGQHLALQMDVTRQSDIERVIAASKEKFGVPPCLLANVAGISNHTWFQDVTKETLDRLIDVNLKGTFIASQVFTKALLEDGTEAREGKGAIVNILSLAAKKPFPEVSPYAATKGAVYSLTKSCAAELGSKGIRVNSVMPGLIDTPLTSPWMEQYSKTSLQPSVTPLARAGRPEEMAEVIVFLLSERSSYMVGACVEATGGCGM